MKLQLNFETFGAIGAIVVSVVALFVAWDQAVVMRQQQHAAVWPIMSVDFTINQTEDFNTVELISSNAGVGPAIIMSATPTMGSDVVARWDDLKVALFGEDFELPAQVSMSSAIGVMAVGEEAQVLAINWARGEEGDAAMMSLVQRIVGGTFDEVGLELCYCSVFDRCWVAGRPDLDFPEQVNGCEASGDFIDTFFVEENVEPGGEQ